MLPGSSERRTEWMVRRMPESEIYSEPARGVKIDLKIVVEDCINQLEAQGAPAQDIAQSRPHADALWAAVGRLLDWRDSQI